MNEARKEGNQMRPGSPARRRLTPALLVMAMVAALLPLGQAATAATNTAIQLNGTTQYATLGTNSQLRSGQFTLELWFKRTGTGTIIGGTGTGNGGLPTTVIPLIAKGRAEAETAAADINYFFGIDSATNKLVADFEEARNTAGGTQEGLNHPIFGNSVVTSNVWHHAAATYDGVAWNLYLDGVNDGTLTVNRVANSATQVITSIGTSLNTSATLTPNGFFQGQVDEVRIWNSARTAGQISAGMNGETPFPTAGLLGRWGLNEGTGTSYGDSSGNAIAGAGVATPTWVAGATPLDPPAPGANASLALNGINQYATMGNTATLGASEFTLEGWINRTGPGVATSTGTGGITSIIPLITKGRGEGDGSNVDMNYFLGIDTTSNRLVADFEDNDTINTPTDNNHPVLNASGSVIPNNTWTHVAATYDGTSWALYVNGNLETTESEGGATPRFDSIQHFGIGSAMTSTGAAAGFFQGQMDEVRVWNVARSQAQIQGSMNATITTATAGLVARYGLNEGTGSAVGDSIPTAQNGTTQPAANLPSWAAGAPALDGDVIAPSAPTGLSATSGEGNVALNWDDNGEGDLAGYNVYRDTSSPVSTAGTPLNGGTPLVASQYDDPTGTPGTAYFYVVTAEDTTGNESSASNEVSDSPDPFSQAALQFDGTNDHVTLGSASGLGAANFTLEAWIKKTGAGATVSTGANGLTAVPLITKGRHDQDGTTEDTNYFFGLDATGHIAVDFEDFAATNNNHPFTGSAVVSQNAWHHVAATYDGNVWRLYLDGSLDTTSPAVNATPRFDSTEHAAIATSLDDSAVEVPEGFFQGQMDEVRIWNVARTPAQIAAAYQLEIPTATGLLGRYSMNEGLGTAVGDSSGTPQDGTAVGGPAWVQGYTFQVGTPNDPPVVDSVTINQASPHTNDTLSVTVTSHDPNSDPVNYSYQWSKNNVDISGATGATLNMATAGNGGKGDAIRVRVVANDGLDDSAPVTSSPVSVLNTIPVASVSIDDTTPGSNDVITATATQSDLDGDTITLTYVWRVNNVVRQTTSNSSSLSDTFDLSLANHGNTSDEVTVTVTPNDGEQDGNAATSATATVQDAASEPNRLPELTWQTNDRVKDILRIGNTVYIAGNFTQIRSNNGAQTMTRNHLAAFDALTGNPLPWNPNANGNVEAITASPDGSIIYAGGVFKKMGGASHQRVAAVSASTGAVQAWNPFVDAAVKAIATQGTSIYLGGAFVNVNGMPRNRLAAVAAGSGNLLGWNPNANNQVRDLVFDSSGTRLFAGGPFTNVGASTQNRIVALDPSTGAPLAFSGARPTVAVITLTADDQGRIFAGSNNSVISYTASTGARNWVVTGDGNIQGLDVEDGTVYAGGHFVTMGTTARNFLAGLDADTGALTAWNATANSVLGVFAVEASADRLYIGGDFTRVSGLDQQGFAMFQVEDNTSPTRPGKPTGVSNTSSSIDLQWAASSDGANPTLTYLVYRDALPNPVGQVVSSSNTTVNFTDNGLTPESVHTYAVVATDGALASSPSDASDQITVMAGADSAPPQLQTIEMRDNDSDGKVDRVVVTFDEALAAYTAGTAPWTLTNVPSAGTLSGVTVAGNQATLAITEGPNAANTAVGTFRVALATNANGIRDMNGNLSSFASVAPADEASPVPINTSRTPGTTSGLLEASGDSFTVTFSEPIDPGTIPGTTTISESDPAGAGNDTLQIVGLTNGQINLGANNYVGDDGTTASFTSSTLTLSGGNTVVKATVVGTCSGTGCASLAIGNSAAIAFSPPTSITDVPGNPATGSFSKSFRMF